MGSEMCIRDRLYTTLASSEHPLAKNLASMLSPFACGDSMEATQTLTPTNETWFVSNLVTLIIDAHEEISSSPTITQPINQPKRTPKSCNIL